MAKVVNGNSMSSTTYNVTVSGAFDDRLVVYNRADLANPLTWTPDPNDPTSVPVPYHGMIVSVINDPVTNNNGAWQLMRAGAYNTYKYTQSPTETQNDYGWRKINSEAILDLTTDNYTILGNGSNNNPLYVAQIDGYDFESPYGINN